MSNTTKQYLDYNGLQTYHNGIKDYIVIHGYYYNGSFYKESTHTTLITPQENRLYIDLGSDIIYEYKSNSYVAFTGTGNYNNLSNKPSINNITLIGNKSLNDLGVASEDSVEIEEFNNKTPYIYRKSAGGDRVYEKLIGGTIAWNQLVVASGSFSFDRDTRRTRNLSTSNVIPVIGHKYFFSMNVVSENLTGSMHAQYGGNLDFTHGTGIKNAIYSASTATPNSVYVYVYMALDESSGAQATIKDVMVIDLTQMFGSTIADYIYSLEQATAGAGVAWFRQMFPNDYYAYDSGSLQSVNVASKKVYDSNNTLVATYTFDSDVTLRGLPKLDSNNNLYYDGDVYESNGTVTRRYGIVDLGSLNWVKFLDQVGVFASTSDVDNMYVSGSSAVEVPIKCGKYVSGLSADELLDDDNLDNLIAANGVYPRFIVRDTSKNSLNPTEFAAAMVGVYVLYPLATQTSENADPFINPQIVDADGTEEFVDYAYSQSTRDVAVPVGHESKYIVFPEWLRNKYFNDLYDKAAGDHTHNSATTTNAGFMSSTDKTKLDGIATNATKVENSSTNGNIKINGTETTVYTHPAGTNPHGTTKSDVGLGNVGNFKAVSTVANQGLSSSEQTNARANIGAGTSSFSGNYDDLSNKPIIDTTVTESSSNLITSGAVYTAIDNLPNPMVFKGTLGSGGTITSLPTASSSNEGYTYKVITAGLYASQSAKVGDVFVSNGSSWVLIPAGDEDTDTWRNIKVNDTELLGTGISTGYVNFKNGNGISVSGNSHDVAIGHSNSVTAGTAKGDNDKTLTFGGTFTIPSVTYDKNGHITSKGTTTMTMPANPNINTVPSALCASGSSVANKTASCTNFTLLNKSYLHVLIENSNTVKSALTFNVNSTGAKAIAINGSASSSTNYELPAGTYLVYYVDNTFYFRTDGKLTANITGTAGYSSKAAASGGTAVSLVTTGEKYIWNNKSDFDGAYASLSGKPTLGTAAALDVAVSGDASSTQVVLGNDSRLTSNIIASSTQPSGQPTGGIWLKIE